MSPATARNSARDHRLNEVLLAYVEAREAGQVPERRLVLAAHPELRRELQEFFEGLDAVERLARPLRDAVGRPAPEPAPPPGPADGLGRLGDFRLLREIGRGGMGVVYEALQVSLNRKVALKVLPFASAIDPRQLQRFKNEAMAAAGLHHEHIVPVFSVGCEQGVHFYAMQLIEGQSLATLIADLRRAGPADTTWGARAHDAAETLGPGEAPPASGAPRPRGRGPGLHYARVAALGRQAALALDHAHQIGIVHRDIKPANLLLGPRGQLWVADFGLAQFSGDVALTAPGEVLGTLRYASPEQALARKGQVGPRSDIYSLGATLYELLTLRPPFDAGDRHALLRQIAQDDPRPPRSVDRAIPVDLETILLKALAKEPDDRYATALELADDLTRFLEDRPVLARRPSLPEKAARWSRRHRAVVLAAVAGLLLLVAGLAAATALTARAYERERLKALEASEQRARAQANFRQARRAVQMLEQISEEELAGNPYQQRLRERMLEAALGYYQDFIGQHRDDPTVQAELRASQARVKTILGELATLVEAGRYAHLHRKEVQDELGLSPEQRAAIAAIRARWHEAVARSWALRPGDRERRFLRLAREQESEVARLLQPWQQERFKQIAFQLLGARAFSDPEVAEALRLTPSQKKQVQAIQDQFVRLPDKPPPGQGDHTPQWLGAAEARKRGRIVRLLTPEQRRRWSALLGAPFTGEPRPVKPAPPR